MSDVEPKKPTTSRGRIAQCIRHLGVAERGVKVNAWRVLTRTMEAENFSFNDIGNWVDDSENENKYTEAEMHEYAQAARAEGIEEGIKIGMVRANGGGGNGHLSLPKPAEMAEFCNDRQSQLNDWERNFIADMVLNTRVSASPFPTRWNRGLRPKQLGTLAKIYIQLGGKV